MTQNKKKVLIFLIAAVLFGIVSFVNNVQAANCGGDIPCGCGDTVTASTTLSSDLNCGGDGLIIGADGVTIDGNNHSLSGAVSTGTIGIKITGYDNATVKNFSNISDFQYGIYFSSSTNSVIQDNSIVANAHYGIFLSNSHQNTLSRNNVSNNGTLNPHVSTPFYGIHLEFSDLNILDGNTVNSNFFRGIDLWFSNNNTLVDNIIGLNHKNGVSVGYSNDNEFINNTINFNPVGFYMASSFRNAVNRNFVHSNSTGFYLISSSDNNLSENELSLNLNDISGSGNNFSANVISHNIQSRMIGFSDIERKRNLNDVVSFDIAMFDIDGFACSECGYNIFVSPEEALNINRNGNILSGSFTVTKNGIYSLNVNVTDLRSNQTKQKFSFLVGDTNTATARFYLRKTNPIHGQPISVPPWEDAKSLLLSAPTQEEIWTCGAWVQNSPDQLPDFPLSSIRNINLRTWHKSDADGYIGIQRFVTYDFTTDAHHQISQSADFIFGEDDFSGVDWMMDYSRNWYWLSMKLEGLNPTWKSSPSELSYADFEYEYVFPAIKSNLNENIEVLSAASEADIPSSVEIVLENLSKVPTSTIMTIDDFGNPFLGAIKNTISGEAEVSIFTPEIEAGGRLTLDSVFLEIVPSAGTVDAVILDWQKSGLFYRRWIESNAEFGATISHIVGDLAPNAAYFVKINGANLGRHSSNAQGEISFMYDFNNDGYAVKTIEVNKITGAGSKHLMTEQF